MSRNLTKSKEYLERAKKVIPSCTQTFSKGPTQFIQGVSPIYLERGDGSHVFDVDGNEYIDYPLALGPVTLGYNYPRVNEAIIKQLKDGITFSLMHPLEVELAELLINIIPCAEMVRFGKNGSDVTAAAVRVARAYTGRDKIACCGYHGWQDWYIGTTTRSAGVPECIRKLTIPFEYNNINSLERIFSENRDEVAGVIIEPIGVVEPENNFLEKVKEITHKNGAILIFDEIVTSFRVSIGGAQEYYNIIPDLACFGKGMANGMPISAIVGKKEIMELFDEIFFSFTFGGEVLSLISSITTIREIIDKNVIEHMWEMGEKFKDGYNNISKRLGLIENTECIGLPPHNVIVFKDNNGNESMEVKSLVQQEVIKRGILFLGLQNFCYSHSDEDIDITLDALEEALNILKDALIEGNVKKYLEGEPVQPVFRKP